MQTKLNLPQKEIFQDIKQYYIKRIKDEYKGQCKRVALAVIREVSNNQDIAEYMMESSLDEALILLWDLKCAIGYDAVDKFYIDQDWNKPIIPWKEESIYYEKINIRELNVVISKYLACNWSSPTFEWFIINPYLRYCFELNRKEITPSSLSLGMAEMLSNTQWKYVLFKSIFKIMGIFFYWVMPIYFTIQTFNNGWFYTSVILAVIQIVPLVFNIITLPLRIIKKFKDQKLLAALADTKMYASAKSWSPTLLLERLKLLQLEINIPEIFPLVSKAIRRDPDVFNILD